MEPMEGGQQAESPSIPPGSSSTRAGTRCLGVRPLMTVMPEGEEPFTCKTSGKLVFRILILQEKCISMILMFEILKLYVQLYFGIYGSMVHIINIEIKETLLWIDAVL